MRELLHGIEQAINTEKYTDLKQYFHHNLFVTTINQNVIRSPEGIDAYFREWFGKDRYLQKLKISLSPDALTELYGVDAPEWGVVHGSGNEIYELTDGRHLDIKTRWTATVSKGIDGHWRILTLHIGTNFYDNPIVSAIQDSIKQFALGGFAAGVLFGGIISFLWLRKKTGKAM